MSVYHSVVQKDIKLKRFIPHFKNNSLTHFSCSCLSVDNLCTDYDNRPDICRKYPFSVFYSEDYIREGCGYYVEMKGKLPGFSSVRLKQKIHCIQYIFLVLNNVLSEIFCLFIKDLFVIMIIILIKW